MTCPANDNPASCEIRAVVRFLHAKYKNAAEIQNKRRGMLTCCVVLLHDNARPHTAARTRALLEYFNWELFDHPPYGPHPTPSDNYLFTCLKNWLGSQHFNNDARCRNVAKLTGGMQTSLMQAYMNLSSNTSASIPGVTALINSKRIFCIR
jgi:hypothetical protein